MLGRSDKTIGCLIVCGFTAEFPKINPLADYLKQQGYRVCCAAMAGQDTPLYEFHHTSYANWVHSVEEVFDNFSKGCDMMIVIGFSIGSVIAAHLAKKYLVDALVVMNTPVCYPDFKRLLKKWTDVLYPKNSTNMYHSLIASKKVSIKMGYNYKKLVHQLKDGLREIKSPLLIIQGKKDDVVKWVGAYSIYDDALTTEKELQFFPKSGHGICADCECRLVCIRIHQFIERVAGNKLLLQSQV